MKRFALPFLTLACAASLSAADYGLGFSVANDSNAITAPIRLQGGIVLEPSVVFATSNEHDGSEKYKQTTFGAGFGVFKHKEVVQSLEFFYGGTLSAGRYTYKDEYTSGTDKESANYIALEPAIGLEYNINKKISFGGKAGVSFQHVHGNDYRYDQLNQVSTFSSLFVRMYF
ncbi:MAG: hypothetical protein H6Q00_2780 [Holophagaceae bacterium]|nr:hypothetical protein [Holophagaceae bacterium]